MTGSHLTYSRLCGYFRLRFTPYVASNHVHIWLRLCVLITLLSLISFFINSRKRFSFYLSSTMLLVTLMRRNNIAGSISGSPLFTNHSSFPTIYCRVYFSCLYSLGIFSFMFCKPFLSVDDTVAHSAYPKSMMDYSM